MRRTPDAIAVVFDDQQVTYGELNSRSNQLAHYLRTMNVGPEAMVGVCVERSLEMVIGLLGILKAGAAYVPLDPEYPTERLKFMLEDSRVPILLTQRHLVPRFSEQTTRLIILDDYQNELSGHKRPRTLLTRRWTTSSPMSSILRARLVALKGR